MYRLAPCLLALRMASSFSSVQWTLFLQSLNGNLPFHISVIPGSTPSLQKTVSYNFVEFWNSYLMWLWPRRYRNAHALKSRLTTLVNSYFQSALRSPYLRKILSTDSSFCRNFTETISFIGFCKVFSCSVQDFAPIAAPWTRQLCKNQPSTFKTLNPSIC